MCSHFANAVPESGDGAAARGAHALAADAVRYRSRRSLSQLKVALRVTDAIVCWLRRLERAFPDGGWAVSVVVDALLQQSEAKAVQETIDVRCLVKLWFALLAPLTPRAPCSLTLAPARRRLP